MFTRRLCALTLILAMFAAPLSARPVPRPYTSSTTGYDGASTVTRIASLVRNEFREEISQTKLVAGAVKGLREYLKKKGLSSAVLADSKPRDLVDFRKVFDSVCKAHPRLSQRELSYAAIRGMLDTLDDPYTVFLDPEEYKNLMGQLNGGNFGGLGIYLDADEKNKSLVIVEPMEGTPAMKAGLRKNDVITEIDGKSTVNMSLDEATRLLRGPVGSTVVLTIRRPGVEAPFKVPVTRDLIHFKTLTYKVINNIGYVKLRVFGDNANEEMEEAFREFDKAHVKGYILDLRNNGGGFITASLDVSSHFLATGTKVVSVAERGSPEIVYNSRPNLREVLPVVVLVNKYSASASEITAGALKERSKVAVLMGETTFGKGSVQKIFPLPDGSAVKVTTAHYHTPDGHDIHKKGIIPDVVVKMDPKDVKDDSTDVQLQAAVSFVQQKIARSGGIASRANTDVVPSHADAIRVASSEEEFNHINRLKAADGGSYTIVDQTHVYENGHDFDIVELRSERGEKKTIWFQLDYFRR